MQNPMFSVPLYSNNIIIFKFYFLKIYNRNEPRVWMFEYSEKKVGDCGH